MQVFFVVTFLSLFFFLYVVTVEKEIFNDQINMVVDALYGNMENSADLVIPQLVQTELKQEILDYLNTVVFSQQDYDDIRKQNEEVINTTKTVVYTFAVTLGACLFVIYFLRFCVDMTHHMIENLLALGAVALTEYLFLNLVSRNYIAANPNHVKLYFAERVFAYSQQKM
jgi:predicted PurR-regulated permease PerM